MYVLFFPNLFLSSFRSFVYLSNLYFGTTLVQRVAIVDNHSRVCGFIRIAVEPVAVESNGGSGDMEEESSGPVKRHLQFDNKLYVETVSLPYDTVVKLIRYNLISKSKP